MSFIYIAPARVNIRGTTYIVDIHLEPIYCWAKTYIGAVCEPVSLIPNRIHHMNGARRVKTNKKKKN